MDIARAGTFILSLSAPLALLGCSAIEPVEQYTLRATAIEGWARIGSGSSSATDGLQETPLHGDQLDASRDLALSASPGQRGVVELRVSNDSEFRATFD